MIAGKKRKAVMVVRLSFFCMLGSQQRIQIQRHQGTKEAVRDDILNNYGDEDSELYPEQEYSYDGFLDDVVRDAVWNQIEESYVSLSGTTGPSYESVPFTCSFSFENLVFCFDYTWDGVEETEFVQGTIGSDGSLDANLQFEDSETGEEYEFGLSEYKNLEKLKDLVFSIGYKNRGIIRSIFRFIVAVVVIYVVVAETAEQIRGKLNYSYNKSLENHNEGVGIGEFVYSQTEKDCDLHNAGLYQFGFADFGSVGCEVASVYNLRVQREQPEYLSETIYKFEHWAIEFSIGWGHLGSNPREIKRYLNREGLDYSRRTSTFFGLSAADADKAFDDYCFRADSCLSDLCLIVSFWNTGIGLHTFFVFKTEGRYFAYNRNEIGDVEDCGEKCINLNNNDFSGFIVGYFIYD